MREVLYVHAAWAHHTAAPVVRGMDRITAAACASSKSQATRTTAPKSPAEMADAIRIRLASLYSQLFLGHHNTALASGC